MAKVDSERVDAVYRCDMRSKPVYRRAASKSNIKYIMIGAIIGLALIAASAAGLLSSIVLVWVMGIVGLAVFVYAMRHR